MTKAIELADKLELEWKKNALDYDTALDSSIELRRLAAVEQELADLKAAMGEPVGRTYVDGFHHTRVKWLKGLPVVGTELYAKAKP